MPTTDTPTPRVRPGRKPRPLSQLCGNCHRKRPVEIVYLEGVERVDVCGECFDDFIVMPGTRVGITLPLDRDEVQS